VVEKVKKNYKINISLNNNIYIIMSNTIYIDANRDNSTSGATTTNEWTYKLNSELLLPKGTNIQLQNSFINKQGITGGSIEIEEDILETITYYHYITETPQNAPNCNYVDDGTSWFRGTLNAEKTNFANNFKLTNDAGDTQITQGDIDALILDFGMTTEGEIKSEHYDYFKAFGGSGMILPRCKIVKHTDNLGYVAPVIDTLEIKIPRGVYGIGQIAQIIEDQINGLSFLDASGKLIKRDTNHLLMQGNNTWEGQPKNSPCLIEVDLKPRSFDVSVQEPFNITGLEGDIFLNQQDFNDLVEFNKTDGTTIGQTQFKFTDYKNTHAIYNLTVNYDDGSRGGVVDDDITLNEYNLFNYNDYGTPQVIKRLIGTTNFSMEYDTVRNGFVLNGLHNVPRQPSHDRMGNEMTNSGQTSIYLKKEASNGRNFDQMPVEMRKLTRSLINRPYTRDMGIAIVNFGYGTCLKEKTIDTGNPREDLQRFGEFFRTDAEKDSAWDKTIWGRLGFSFNQLGNHKNFNKQDIYNKHTQVPEYGFTTDVPIDVSMIPTVSTLTNPTKAKQWYPDDSKGDGLKNVELNNTLGFAFPKARISEENEDLYINSLLTTTAMIPIVIDSVGGIIADKLPRLSKHGYYLITSDILDNFKDNVKKGDVLPLLGVVPKSSESNQDYITANNQIIQVLSQDKVLNKIKIKVLNPDLTNPHLGNSSSVLMKITMPYITPISLMPPKEQKLALEGENQ
tara:strand:- start:1227 stop:3425 length:2199 start_codon:yes stop_codon:yes gene_type:complete